MRSLRTLAALLTLALPVVQPGRAAAQPQVVGVVGPKTVIVPKDGAYTMVVMEPLRPRDKTICQIFVARYGASPSYQPASGAYGLYWLTPQPRALTRADCEAPPADGLSEDLYDYRASPEVIRQLYLPNTGGPFLVVVKCDPDGASPVNAGYLDLGAVPPDRFYEKLTVFEDYLRVPESWGKKRQIDRGVALAAMDFLRAPARLVGRNTGLIKRMEACRMSAASTNSGGPGH